MSIPLEWRPDHPVGNVRRTMISQEGDQVTVQLNGRQTMELDGRRKVADCTMHHMDALRLAVAIIEYSGYALEEKRS